MIKPITGYGETISYNSIKTAPNQVSFTGINVNKISRKVNNELVNKTEHTLIDFIQNSGKKLKNLFNLNNTKDLPVTEKPLIAKMSVQNNYDDNTLNLLKLLEKHKIDISGIGEVKRHSKGGLLDIDKGLIKGKINKALEAKEIDSKIAETLNSKVSYCGKFDDSIIDAKSNLLDENLISTSHLSDNINDLGVISRENVNLDTQFHSKVFEDLGFNFKENWDLDMDFSNKIDIDPDIDFLGKLDLDSDIGLEEGKLFDFDFDLGSLWDNIVDFFT